MIPMIYGTISGAAGHALVPVPLTLSKLYAAAPPSGHRYTLLKHHDFQNKRECYKKYVGYGNTGCGVFK